MIVLHGKQIHKITRHLLILFKQLILKQILSKINITFISTKTIYDSFLFRDLTSRPHLAGLPEDLESATVIEQRWINDSLQVTKSKYNVLLSYPDENNPNRFVQTTHTNSYLYLLLFCYYFLELLSQVVMVLSFFKQMVLKKCMIQHNPKQSIHFLLIHPMELFLV